VIEVFNEQNNFLSIAVSFFILKVLFDDTTHQNVLIFFSIHIINSIGWRNIVVQ